MTWFYVVNKTHGLNSGFSVVFAKACMILINFIIGEEKKHYMAN